jgi:hypothetical protein
MSYDSYANWLKNHTDKFIGGNYLTHKQLFWMANGLKTYTKYHRHAPVGLDYLLRLQSEYFHVFYKSKVGFQEAFNCSINEEELKQFEEYRKRVLAFFN